MTKDVFSQYLDPHAICVRISARTAAEVIAQLAARLEAGGFVKPSYGPAVVLREETLPTGLPLGDDIAVAVPHTDVEHVIRSGFAIATLAEPVEFGSMEDPDQKLPVRVVFALALKDKTQQIEMLQTIAAMLQKPATIHRIADASSVSDVIEALDIGTMA